MRLSVFTAAPSEQLFIDLKKLYGTYLPAQQLTIESLQNLITDSSDQLFVTMFNERHLGAIRVTIDKQSATLDMLTVRDLTRRRGIAKNLLVEVEKHLLNKQIRLIKMDLTNIKKEEIEGLTLFMQACGYHVKEKVCEKEV